MLSSYNIINSEKVVESKSTLIETKYEFPDEDSICSTSNEKHEAAEKYKKLANTMIENARKQSEEILAKANEKVAALEKESSKRGYKEGFDRGLKEGNKKAYDDSYKEAYEKNVVSAKKRAQEILNNASDTMEQASRVLKSAKLEYMKYFEDKKDDIKNLIITSIESIMKKELSDEKSVDNMIFEAMSISKNAKTFIIKCREKYVPEVKSQVEKWKIELGMKSEVFVVEDNFVDEGNVVIEKNNGKIIVGIKPGLEKIKEILNGKG